MKKIFVIMTMLCFGLCFSLSAESEDVSKKVDDTTVESKSEKKFGGAIGVRVSILGVEPSVSLIGGNTEVEVYCPVMQDYSSDGWEDFTLGPGVSWGYLSSPFEKGFQNGVGAAYNCYYNLNLHAWSLYYKLGVRFNNGSNLMFRTMVPLVMWETDSNTMLSIAQPGYFWGSFLASHALFSVGYRYYF